MKQSLQLKVSQQLAITPQLQQAIRLLQLSTLELQQEIQSALESNPLLENEEEDSTEDAQTDEPQANDSTPSAEVSAQATDEDDSPTGDDQWSEQIPEQLSTDSSWDDTFQHAGPASSGSANSFDDMPTGSNDTVEESLQDHLLWQLNLTPMSDADRLVAQALIDGIDASGYLRIDLDELSQYLQENAPELSEDFDPDALEAVLHRIQQFDPAGVGARNLSECLRIQLEQLPNTTPWRREALLLTEKHLKLLGSRDFRQLVRRLRISEDQLREVIALIQSLNPQPGESITSNTAEYVIPDVLVTKEHDYWQVNLNPEIAPKLRVNADYAGLIRRADNSADNTYLKNHLQEARWFIKSLHSRNDTLLKVAREIVAHQQDFFDEGEEAMKPLVLHNIAEAVDMHESTISRVTTQKYMHTPRGIFELKYFFSSQVGDQGEGGASSTAIRAVLKKLIAAENPAKPLSDNKLSTLLDEQGYKVARRTIAKYREAMGIAPSNERKRLV